MIHDNDEPQLDRAGRESWADWFTRFKRDSYPLFRREGIDVGTAALLFEINELRNMLRDLLTAQSDIPGDGEEDTEGRKEED